MSEIINENTSLNPDEVEVQEQLLVERRIRITIMSLLLSALLFTAIYGTIQDPFRYTFSKIGNRFDHRALFIVWAMYTGISIQTCILALFRLENYKFKLAYYAIFTATIFLITSSITPSLAETYPLWTWIHIITAGLYGLFLTLGLIPFLMSVSKENPRLRLVIKVWAFIIWAGSVGWMFLLGNTGIFELWGFGSVIVLLLYLSLTLFEETIVKRSVTLLKGDTDLNLGIERIFFKKKEKKKKSK